MVSHHHPPIALAQPGPRFPGNLAHRIRKAVTVRRLDQQGSGVDVASLGDSTNAATLAEGVCRRMVRCGASGTGDGSLTALSRPMEAAPISGALLDHVAALADPRLHAKVLFPLPEILLPGFSRRHCRGG